MPLKLGFTDQSPIYQLYQGLIHAGVRPENLDRGYLRIDYAKPGPNATRVNEKGVIEEQEVLDYALERYEKFQNLIEGYLEGPLPWSLEDPQSDFDETVRSKIGGALKTYEPLLAKFKKGSAKYQERLAEALFRYLSDPDDRGLGLNQFREDAPMEASALEALQLKQGWCTERSKILFALLKTAGLKPQFVYVPSRAVLLFAKARGLEIPFPFRNQDHVAVALHFGQRLRIFDPAIFDSDAKYQEYYLLGLRHFLSIDRNNRGLDLARMDREGEAETEFYEAVRLNPEFPATHTNLCSFRSDERKLEELEAHCRMAIKLDPLGITPRYALGRHYASHKKNREAIAIFGELLKIDPLHFDARHRLGQLLEEEGLELEAIQEYRETIRLEPNIPAFYYQLAQLLVRRGEMPEAIALYEKVVKLMPPPPPVYFHYGVALWRSGRKEEAVSALEKMSGGMTEAMGGGQITADGLRLWLNRQLTLITPEMKKDGAAMRPLGRIFLALSNRYRDEKRLEDAREALQKAHELDP